METTTSLFNFITIRNPSAVINNVHEFEILPQTAIITALIGVIESNSSEVEKITLINQQLNAFIQSPNFYKTKQNVLDAVDNIITSSNQGITNSDNLNSLYINLYNNIVIRSITKSTTNEVFKQLSDSIKFIFQRLNSDKITIANISRLKILFSERLIFSFSPPPPPSPTPVPAASNTTELSAQINDLIVQHEQTGKQIDENTAQIHSEQQKIAKSQNDKYKIQIQQQAANAQEEKTEAARFDKNLNATDEISADQTAVTRNAADEIFVARSAVVPVATDEISTDVLDNLIITSEVLSKSKAHIGSQLSGLYANAFSVIKPTQYIQVANQYVNVTNFGMPTPIIDVPNSIDVYSQGCKLKFPFQIADLRVIEHKTVGYLPAEIAHINNTQQGESQQKVTRRLKRTETFESLIAENETFRETDNQSTEKFSMEKAAAEVKSEETSLNINASASYDSGLIKASIDGGYSDTQSTQNSNSSSQSYAKEVVQKVVDRVSNKVRMERSIKTTEEFEETVTHLIDNTKGDGPKSYVYRWLTKLVKATLKNYGKRLTFQIDIPHPSQYYLAKCSTDQKAQSDQFSAQNNEQIINIPPDPKNLTSFGANLVGINEYSYIGWGTVYNVKLPAPPTEKIIVSKGFVSKTAGEKITSEIAIPTGYRCLSGKLNGTVWGNNILIFIGAHNFAFNFWNVAGSPDLTDWTGHKNEFSFDQLGTAIKDVLPITFFPAADYSVNIEIDCVRMPEHYKEWQISCYQQILDAYDKLKSDAESKMSEWNPNNPGINPDKKNGMVKTEIKKGALSKMFRCNPFWLTDDYVVGNEYAQDCCKDNFNAEQVRFLETVFDWSNMTYELYPYFYGDKKNWAQLLNLQDDDPHFEAFLQASYATVRIPVYRDSQKEIAAMNFILNNSIANYSVLPANLQHVIEDLQENTPFGYITENSDNPDFIDIKREYDKSGNLKIFYIDASYHEIICTEKIEFDKEGNQTIFYYDPYNKMVISEIKDGTDSDSKRYSYYFNDLNEKIICRRTQTEYNIYGNATPFYSTDLGIFSMPTDLVILEAGVQNGVELRGYPEDASNPSSDVIIPKQYSPAIIQK